MAALIATCDWLVQPWHRQVQINGEDPPSLATPAGEPLSSSACEGSKLVFFPASSDLKVHVRAESWTAEPLTGDTRLDIDAATWTLHVPAGQITISDLDTADPLTLDLSGSGYYQVRINAFYTDTWQLYDDACKRSSDFDDPAFQTEVAKLTGRELWLLRLWPASR
jgi:hypothetical protein